MDTPRLPTLVEQPTGEALAAAVGEFGQWAVTRGLVKDVAGVGVTHAPLTLGPAAFPKAAFETVWGLQSVMNTLLHASAADGDMLHAVLDPVAAQDPFVARQLDILDAIGGVPGGKSGFAVGIWRTDYLLHQPAAEDEIRILQVENNAISVAYAALSSIVCSLHEYALTSGLATPAAPFDSPPNGALKDLVLTISSAHELYLKHHDVAAATVVMVVQPGELNQYDQRWIQYVLFESFGVNLVRASHADLIAGLAVDDDSLHATYNGTPVSVFYFRAGYTPDDYPTDAHWEVRADIEASSSIKIPDIAHQLAGSKAIQRALTDRDLLVKYVGEADADAALAVFARMHALPANDDAATAVLAVAAANPDGWVLKPQREGGGNNLYRAALAQAIASMPRTQLEAYILMERIVPPLVTTTVVRNSVASVVDGVSELGIFGFYIKDINSGKEIYNAPGGYLLRTKPADVDEGGVSAGVAFLDSVALYDDASAKRPRDDAAPSASSSAKKSKPLDA